jgi:hypothetical protein
MTLRIDEAMAAEVDVARRVLDVTAADLIREAVGRHLEELRSDPEFQARLDEVLMENARALEQARLRRTD